MGHTRYVHLGAYMDVSSSPYYFLRSQTCSAVRTIHSPPPPPPSAPGSAEEIEDVRAAYVACDGDMGGILDRVPCASVDSEDRLREIVQGMIDDGELPALPAFTDETKAKRTARKRRVSCVPTDLSVELQQDCGPAGCASLTLSNELIVIALLTFAICSGVRISLLNYLYNTGTTYRTTVSSSVAVIFLGLSRGIPSFCSCDNGVLIMMIMMHLVIVTIFAIAGDGRGSRG